MNKGVCPHCQGSGEVLIEECEEYQGVLVRIGSEVDTCPVCNGTGRADDDVPTIPF